MDRATPIPVPARDRKALAVEDIVWLGAGLGVAASAYVITGSAAVQALAVLAYAAVGAVIAARRHEPASTTQRDRRKERIRLPLCIALAGAAVYAGTPRSVRDAVGPWFEWWLAIGAGIVLSRHWPWTRASD